MKCLTFGEMYLFSSFDTCICLVHMFDDVTVEGSRKVVIAEQYKLVALHYLVT